MATEIALTQVNCPYIAEGSTPQLTTLTGTGMAVSPAENVIRIGSGLALLIFNNTDVGAQTVNVTSSNDPFGRTADITSFSIPAGDIVARFFRPVGWEQNLGAGDIIVSASDAAVELVAIPVNC